MYAEGTKILVKRSNIVRKQARTSSQALTSLAVTSQLNALVTPRGHIHRI